MVKAEIKKQLIELQEKLKILKMNEINTNKHFITTKSYACLLNNGELITREKILKNESDGNAVIILPLTKQNETILVVQPRVFTKTGVSVEIPAGYIDEFETPEDAALRELKEETGYVPEKLIKLASYYQDQGCSASFNTSFLAIGCEKKYPQKLDKDEYIHYLTCDFEDVVELVSEGIINDANSLIAINEAQRILKKGDLNG